MIIDTVKVEKLSTGHSLEGLLNKANAFESVHIDYYQKLRETKVDDKLTISLGDKEYHITEYALSQLCGKLGVPVTYLKKCYKEGKVRLAMNNLVTWMKDDDRDILFRSYGHSIRGILSNRYSVLDNRELLSNLLESNILRGFDIKSAYMDMDRLHMRVVDSQMIKIDGEDLFAGIQIDNSDVGKSSLSVKYLIYKQVCSNGLILPRGEGVLFRQKHIGISAEEFRDGLKHSLDVLPDLVAKTKDIVNTNRQIKLTQEELDVALEKIKRDTFISEDNIETVKKLTTDRYGLNNWGLINSITQISQEYSLDRRLELEKYASKLLIA